MNTTEPTKVFVYRNLHKNCWSVRSCETRRVVAHVERIVLEQAKGRVSQAGRERVLREKRKNVHAGIEGLWYPHKEYTGVDKGRSVTYNPYKYSSFVYRDTEEPLDTGETIALTEEGRVWTL